MLSWKPADDLLVFRASDGWEPLCDFLGKPVPVTGNEMPALRVRPKVTATAPEATETITSNVQAWFDLAKAATASQEAAAASPGKKGTQAVASPSKPTKQPATNP